MSVVVVGLQHRRASLDVLERVSVADVDAAKVRTVLRDCANLEEAVLLSTCLRTEVYAVVDRFHDAVAEIESLLAQRAGLEPEQLADQLDIRFDDGVAIHLFRVAAGLESAVPGESEVLGQVRRSWEQARHEGLSGPVLGDLFRHALVTGKRVRSDTAIGRGTTSFSHAAVDLVEAYLDQGASGARVVVAGAGAMGKGIVTALADRRSGPPSELTVASRHRQTAEELAAEVRRLVDVPAHAVTLDELPRALNGAEVLFAALDVDGPVIGPEHLDAGPGRDGHPLVVVDMGMPRNVAAAGRSVPGVTVLDLDDLRTAVGKAVHGRHLELADAEAIVAEEVDRYRSAARARGAAPVVAALRNRMEELRRGELDRRRGQHGQLSDDEWALVDEATRAVLAKLVHEPTVTLKQAAGTPRGERLVEALRILFDL